MTIFKNNFNYQTYDSSKGYLLFADSTNKKYKFYFRYNLKSEIKQVTQIPKHWIIFNKITISIIFIIFISLLTVDMPTNDKLYNQYYATYQSPINNNRSISYPSDSVEIAYKKLCNNDYKSALDIFHKIKNKDTVTYFYMGVAHQELGEYKDAISEYEKVIKNNDNLLVEQSKWYIGLCYLKLKDRNKALEQFKILSESKSYYQLPAEEIIKKIK